ncbi:ABC transporter permease [Wenxinia marina]|uniref:ABC-type dipeptide/oligopeptide/nickel transport system, permease component n=1 Tax=Wenxinia marina DSM 24838 TaxID=1123501 RepID=A0A0D0Q125_9RHOB|nr:ABC transporter permease [Wenxinia marina]KIQ68244.1 ABC-type dipeptide/oligopeptide/nickel transport system, permease component [Wenxinia marina DSM 24838]GGL77034.1 peptide ABC transporter permease [Wenxinia marina]
MAFYFVKRLGLSALVVGTVLLVLFSLLHMIPGNPAILALGTRATPEAIAEYTARMRLDEPVWVQFVHFVSQALRGDLGADVFSNRPVTAVIGDRIGFSLALILTGMGWAVLLGVPLGCLAAVRPRSWVDRVTGILSVGTIAVPSFLVAIWSLLLFSLQLHWLPAIGAGEPGDLSDQLSHLILPAFAIGLGWVGYLARMVRASMLEVLGEPYIRSARAFGLPPRRIVGGYALRVAILPTITLIGMGFGGLISSAVFAEIIFARPGVGKMIFDAVSDRNFPLVQGGVLVATAFYILVVLVSDLVIAWLDPRVRSSL